MIYSFFFKNIYPIIIFFNIKWIFGILNIEFSKVKQTSFIKMLYWKYKIEA